ncbi:unnamed protein product [Blepharisma stoltei]|uniref:Cyclic nucleotide-binding domain-containing protein n=1 Tax=Blepharisma stoltei TaxID=1481888 RepID=A0AAU9ITL9_9CILI|nr:unnamed protein product [Blepharisma stoltei]
MKDHRGAIKLIKFAIFVAIVVHVMGCLWYLIAKLDNFSPNTWVARHGYIDSDKTSCYIASIYFIFTTLTTVGYGDIHAYTKSERAFVFVLMALGVAFYSYTISNLSTIMANMDSKTSNLRNRLNALNDFAKATKLPDDLKQKIKAHILLNYEENMFSWFDQDTLMNELPASLRTDVSLHMHHKIVEKIYFFQDKDPGFISYIVPKLRTVSLQPGEFLYKEYEFPDEVYFLTKGRVNLIASNGVVFKSYVQGSYFGEVEIMENTPRDCSVQATKDGAEFLVLSKRHFLKMLEEFPKIAEEINDTSRLRCIKNSEAKETALKIETKKAFILDRQQSWRLKKSSTRNLEKNDKSPKNSDNNKKNKQKTMNFKKEKFRKMWQNIIEEKKEENKSEIARRKKENSLKGSEPQSPDNKPNLRTLKRHPTMMPGVKMNVEKIRSARRHSTFAPNIDKFDSLERNPNRNYVAKTDFDIPIMKYEELEVDSPLATEENENKDPKHNKLQLLKMLYAHLSKHNAKLHNKLRVSKGSLALLQNRQGYIKEQVTKILTFLKEESEEKSEKKTEEKKISRKRNSVDSF